MSLEGPLNVDQTDTVIKEHKGIPLKRVALCVLTLSIVMLLLGVWVFREEILFVKLRWHRKDTVSARKIALELREDRDGLRLAAEDCDIFGGSTRGWSSWILATSPLEGDVEDVLNRIIESRDDSKARRAEALWIMWSRTRAAFYLRSLFQIAVRPGGSIHKRLRSMLAKLIRDEVIARILLNTPLDEMVQLSFEQFEGALISSGEFESSGGRRDSDPR